ncbi:MAG: hypothetical protein A6F72_04315 [Cycloclasticus sp. symbiont of Poecilosclerida sp. N]|nr:MAG: hypothetical protein A6F72_04315 [Cycloclasticus sp. symbiont of Poecilosclerida sp. N]
MAYFYNNSALLLVRIICGLSLLMLLLSPVVNASSAMESMCENTPGNGETMGHASMGQNTGSSKDCCQLGTMYDCFKTCHIGALHISNIVAFTLKQPADKGIASIVRRISSLNVPPLLRPPVSS